MACAIFVTCMVLSLIIWLIVMSFTVGGFWTGIKVTGFIAAVFLGMEWIRENIYTQ